MLKSRYSALIISLSLHLLFLIFITYAVKPVSVVQIAVPPLQSYLYTRPPPKPAEPELEPETTQASVIEETIAQPVAPQTPPAITPTAKPSLPKIADDPIINKPHKTAQALATKAPALKALADKAQTTKAPTFSPYGQLTKLTDRINREFIEQQKFTTQPQLALSVMHSKPVVVPHSTPVKDGEKQRKLSTVRYTDDLSITKGDDGTCSISQDLSNVGMEGITALQSFACGETKMQKGFRQHMKKVLKKLGK